MKAKRPLVSLLLLGLIVTGMARPARAVGNLADVQIVDRETGQRLPVYRSGGRYYVAGRPGNRYAVEVRNRLGERIMSVMSVDGINAVSGETANWAQTGYVWSAYESSQITGWRKSMAQVAAFQFALLENSYAARTSRPDQVGVIGVALFREQMMQPQVVSPPLSAPVPAPAPAPARESTEANRAGGTSDAAAPAEAASKSASASGKAEMESRMQRERVSDLASADEHIAPLQKPATRLGTAHGQIETSRIAYTDFERRSPAPDEIISIYYDSAANLIAQGIMPVPIARLSQPFPQAFPGNGGFVPDPPRW